MNLFIYAGFAPTPTPAGDPTVIFLPGNTVEIVMIRTRCQLELMERPISETPRPRSRQRTDKSLLWHGPGSSLHSPSRCFGRAGSPGLLNGKIALTDTSYVNIQNAYSSRSFLFLTRPLPQAGISHCYMVD